MKKVIYSILTIIILILVIINLSFFAKRNCLKNMQTNYSFIIGKNIDYSFIDSTQQDPIKSSKYILNIVSPTCEDCYVKINKWKNLASLYPFLKNNIIFIVTGNEFERLDNIIADNKNFYFLFDYKNKFFLKNPHILFSQTYLIDNESIILCGDPLSNKMIMNIFMDHFNK